jgi:hypothetical protein
MESEGFMDDVTEAVQGNDDLCTPEWILDLVRKMGPILIDPCSNRWSKVGAVHSIHKLGDGLSYSWPALVLEENTARSVAAMDLLLRTGVAYVNPPYSRPAPWVRKCAESARSGLQVLSLLKTDPSTRWTRDAMCTASAKADFRKRITFVGGAHKSGKMASTMYYWGARPYKFCDVFQDHCDVFVLRGNR